MIVYRHYELRQVQGESLEQKPFDGSWHLTSSSRYATRIDTLDEAMQLADALTERFGPIAVLLIDSTPGFLSDSVAVVYTTQRQPIAVSTEEFEARR